MKAWSLFIGTGLWLAGLSWAACAADAQGASSQAALLEQSSIVFSGTVSQLGATSFADVPKSAQTIVVHVDAVLKKPSAVSLKRGDNVTVGVKDPSAFQEGTHATFYTDGWIFGSGVAVKELGHEISPAGEAAKAPGGDEKGQGQAQEQISDQELRDRMNAADFVVVGRVRDVHPWATPKSKTPSHVTEHDPDWHDAVIQVESTLKGAKLKKNRLVVRYPQCNDVAWARAPKFEKNQKGVFFLKKDEVSGRPMALLGGKEVSAYTCLRPGDWLPVSEEARVRALLKSR